MKSRQFAAKTWLSRMGGPVGIGFVPSAMRPESAHRLGLPERFHLSKGESLREFLRNTGLCRIESEADGGRDGAAVHCAGAGAHD